MAPANSSNPKPSTLSDEEAEFREAYLDGLWRKIHYLHSDDPLRQQSLEAHQRLNNAWETPHPQFENWKRYKEDLLRAKTADIREGQIKDLVQAVGRRYEQSTLTSYETTKPGQIEAVAAIRRYVEDFETKRKIGAGMLLYGPAGTGKDHLLVGAARFLIETHSNPVKDTGNTVPADYHPSLSICCLDGMTFFSDLRTGIGNKNFNESDFLDRYTAATVLIVSDPLAPQGKITDYQASMLFRIVDGRYRDNRPIWVSMNVASYNEAADRLTPQIIDRLRDGALSIHCNWPSYRKAQENINGR